MKSTYTVLRRKGGSWDERIVSLLVNNLMTEVTQLPAMPEYLALFGHYERQQILDAMGGGGWVGEPLQYVEARSCSDIFAQLRQAEKNAPEEVEE